MIREHLREAKQALEEQPSSMTFTDIAREVMKLIQKGPGSLRGVEADDDLFTATLKSTDLWKRHRKRWKPKTRKLIFRGVHDALRKAGLI